MSNLSQSSADQWTELATREERWATFLESPLATHPPERPSEPSKRAQLYRNVALSIQLGEQTGVAYCSCTTPPHPLPRPKATP